MSMHNSRLAALALAIVLPVGAQESPQLGKPVDAATLDAIDYTVLPNGDGLPGGSGNALDGAVVFQQHCIACHGEGAAGGVNDALVGGRGSLTTAQPKKSIGSYWPYATTIFDYVRRAMPLQAPGTLSSDEIYAVTAYLLYLNEIVGERDLIDAETLPAVKMPNRDGFTWAYAP